MWSEKYNYYNIQFDEHFSQKLDKSIVVECLLETNRFKQTNHQTFTNTDEFPWVDLILVETYDGNLASSETEDQYVTLVAIVCLKGEYINQKIYVDLFSQIAEKLHWKLYLELDDDGIENIEIH